MLYPQARRAIEATADDVPVYDPSVDIDRLRAEVQEFSRAQPRDDVAQVADHDADTVTVRVYRPESPIGTIVHLHGGGFVLNDIEVHDAICRAMTNRSQMNVVSVEYRRPPEHPFPAAPDDVDRVIEWLGRRTDLTGPFFAHGDSAGANLALGAAHRNPGFFRAMVLIYPFIDARMDTGSYSRPTGFTPKTAAWFWEQYAGGADRLDAVRDLPDFSPARLESLAGLPPALVVSAEHDILRDEAETLAARLAQAGVEVVAVRYLGLDHGFWRMVGEFDAAEPLMVQACCFMAMHA